MVNDDGGSESPVVASESNTSYGKFQAIGPLKTHRNNEQTDLIEAVASVTSAAQILFIELKRNHTYTYGVCSYKPPLAISDKQSMAYKVFSRHTVALSKAGLIRRLPKKFQRKLELPEGYLHFILNPYFIRCIHFEEAKKIWLTLTK